VVTVPFVGFSFEDKKLIEEVSREYPSLFYV